MRKVYHSDSSSVGLWISFATSIGLTVLLFGSLPFVHRIANPDRSLELRKTTAVDQPPDVEEEIDAPPPPETEQPPETPPEPQLADAPQDIPLSADLEVAVGSGAGLVGYGEVAALAAVETVQDQAFDVTELERRPVAVSQVATDYPAELRKAKIEGSVTLIFVLSEEGRVEDPRVENSTRPEFEKPALDAIRKWRFQPGERDGKAVRSYIRVPIKFRAGSG